MQTPNEAAAAFADANFWPGALRTELIAALASSYAARDAEWRAERDRIVREGASVAEVIVSRAERLEAERDTLKERVGVLELEAVTLNLRIETETLGARNAAAHAEDAFRERDAALAREAKLHEALEAARDHLHHIHKGSLISGPQNVCVHCRSGNPHPIWCAGVIAGEGLEMVDRIIPRTALAAHPADGGAGDMCLSCGGCGRQPSYDEEQSFHDCFKCNGTGKFHSRPPQPR